MMPRPRPNSPAAWSRLELYGEWVADSAFRIGDGSPDGVAFDLADLPFIPAGSLRGALRTHCESMLRAMDSDAMQVIQEIQITGTNNKPVPMLRRVGLACDSVDKPANSLNYQGCLTEAIVQLWAKDPLVALDQAVPACACLACRVFGASWLRGKLHLSDLPLIPDSWDESDMLRGGITLNRDTGTRIPGQNYERRALPPGVRFTLRLILENATLEEQGMVLLGLRAFELGWIALGADRARGLGWGHLEIDWWNCRYADQETWIEALLFKEPLPFTEEDAEARIAIFADFVRGLNRKQDE
jgi:CRISPR-associated RAMP protein (TIGR02581 family)